MRYQVGQSGWWRKKPVWWHPGPGRMLLTDEEAASGLIDQAVAVGRPVWFFGCGSAAGVLRHPVFAGQMVSMHFFGGDTRLFHGVNPLRGLSPAQVRSWLDEMVRCYAVDCFFEDPTRELLSAPEHQDAITCFLDEWADAFFLHTREGLDHDVKGLMEMSREPAFLSRLQDLPVFRKGLSAHETSIALRDVFVHLHVEWFSSRQEAYDLPSLLDLGGHVLLCVPYGRWRSPVSVQFANFIIASLSILGQHLPEDKGPLIITSAPRNILSGSRIAAALTRIPGAALVHCLEFAAPGHVEEIKKMLGEQTNFTSVIRRFTKSGYRFREAGGGPRRIEVPVSQWGSRQVHLTASPDLGARCMAHRQARDLQAQTVPVQAQPTVRRI